MQLQYLYFYIGHFNGQMKARQDSCGNAQEHFTILERLGHVRHVVSCWFERQHGLSIWCNRFLQCQKFVTLVVVCCESANTD